MKEYTHRNLNIVRLLIMGDLDIRRIAVEDVLIEADEYFTRITDFLENAPQIVERLNDSGKTQDEVLPVLEEVNEVLTGIGFDKLSGALEELCNAAENGDFSKIPGTVPGIAAAVNALYEKTKSAYTVKRFSGTAAPQKEEEDEEREPILLGEVLEYYDYLESNRKLRILAVDDIMPVLNTVTSILRPHYDVFAIKDSSQVEGFLKHTTPELFLLDIEMGGINGFELIPIIRQFEKHKDTPIIFLTGNASMNNLKDAITLGACDFITKPIDKAVLLEKIKRNIVRKRSY